MPRVLTEDEAVDLYEHMLQSASKQAIAARAKGRFDYANLWEEHIHQLEQYDYFWPGRFPGIESLAFGETVRFYERKDG